ncbi:unnamed protein product [Closterium sp. Yama58-4]|nr:unnamed protein product [Closterium sp. Yama58-4]
MATVARVLPHNTRTGARGRDYINMYAAAGQETLSDGALRAAALKGELPSHQAFDAGEPHVEPAEVEEPNGNEEDIEPLLLGDEWAWLEHVDGATASTHSPHCSGQAKPMVTHTHPPADGPLDAPVGSGASKPVVTPSTPLHIPPVALSDPSPRIVTPRGRAQAPPPLPGGSKAHAAFCSPGRAPFSSPRCAPISSPVSQAPANYTPVRREENSPARESGASASDGGANGVVAREERGATPEGRRVAELEEEMRELKRMVARQSRNAPHGRGQGVRRSQGGHHAKTASHSSDGGPKTAPVPKIDVEGARVAANPLLYDPMDDSPAADADASVHVRPVTNKQVERPLKRVLFNNPLSPTLRPERPPRQDGVAGGAGGGLGRQDGCAVGPRGTDHGGPSVGAFAGPYTPARSENVRSRGRRERGEDATVVIVVDYDPDARVLSLPRGMPPAEKILVVTYFPKNGVRNKALRLSLRRHFDVVEIDIRVAVADGNYSSKVGKVFSKFRNESSTNARHVILRVLRINAGGPYKQEITPTKKEAIYTAHGPRK